MKKQVIKQPASRQQTVEQKTLAKCALPKKPYVILIVDDAETDRTTYRRYMEAAAITSITFIEAENGEYGLTLCQQLCPNLILLDYKLPDIDGLAFLQTLKTQVSAMPPVIMLTGEGNEHAAVSAMKLGARDYLVKRELSETALTQAVQRVITQQALEELTSRQERQQKLLIDVARQINRLERLPTIMGSVVDGLRELLACDRILIYRFDSDLSGRIVAKSVRPKWRASLPTTIADTCFRVDGVDQYQQGHVSVINNVAKAALSSCHSDMLEQHNVKANLAVPIIVWQPEIGPSASTARKKVWGLLIAHSCQSPRAWREDEQALLDSLAVQVAIAIRQAK